LVPDHHKVAVLQGSGMSILRHARVQSLHCLAQVEILRVCLDATVEGSTLVEVGAGFGAATVFLADAAGREGTVLAFEPQSRSFQVGDLRLDQQHFFVLSLRPVDIPSTS
jgi:precorrin-6B methylase 2